MKTDLPEMIKVDRVVKEAENHYTVFFKKSLKVKPGQFVMVWIPGVDEKPYAVSYCSRNTFGVTSHTIGKWTRAFQNLKKGQLCGIRGPYGNNFSTRKNACVVAGGVGISSVAILIEKLKNPLVIYGSRTKKHLIYQKRFRNMAITTNDGSFGLKGFATGPLKKALQTKKISMVYSCGPEIMMKKVLELCNESNVDCEMSLERYMACGFGVCGKCALDDQLICVDGPVYNRKQLNKLTELGRFARLKSGRKVSLQEYAAWRE